MKTLLSILVILSITSCTKRLSVPTDPANLVLVEITGETYATTVNGSAGYYWKITASINTKLNRDVKLKYQFEDSGNRLLWELTHTITAGTQINTFQTQLPASGKLATITKVKLITVEGADEYVLKLK
jgi:hypothetical protein